MFSIRASIQIHRVPGDGRLSQSASNGSSSHSDTFRGSHDEEHIAKGAGGSIRFEPQRRTISRCSYVSLSPSVKDDPSCIQHFVVSTEVVSFRVTVYRRLVAVLTA